MKQLGIIILPLDGMLVHRKVTPSIKFASTQLYTWVEIGTVRVKCLAQEHHTIFPARYWTQTVQSGVKRTNHEATVPLIDILIICKLHCETWCFFIPRNVACLTNNASCKKFMGIHNKKMHVYMTFTCTGMCTYWHCIYRIYSSISRAIFAKYFSQFS